jgi:hypothetical protein
LFSPGADTFLAAEALRSRDSVASILETWSIGATTALARAAINAAVREYLPDLQIIERKAQEPQALDALEFLTSKLLSPKSLNPELFHSALSMVVLSQWTEQSDQFRRQVLQFILNDYRLGNPRFPDKSPNWNPVDQKVSQRVRGWLAREDIVFFFDFVLPDIQDIHHRKEFWLQYVDQIEDSQVVLCIEDRNRLKSQVSEQMAYSNMSGTGVSAFLLRFKGARHIADLSLFNGSEADPDTVVAEFSQPGNAVYFYEANIFKTKVGEFSRNMFSVASLKRDDRLTKFSHRPKYNKSRSRTDPRADPGQWQQDVRTFLAQRGVRLG